MCLYPASSVSPAGGQWHLGMALMSYRDSWTLGRSTLCRQRSFYLDDDRFLTLPYNFFFFFQAEHGIRDDLVTGVQTCALPISLRQEALQFAVRPVAAGDETGCAGGQPGRGPHVADALPEADLDGRDRHGLVGGGLRFFLCILVEQWNEVEVEIALAERLQRLALEIEPRRGPERVDRIGEQQYLDAAGRRRFQPGIRLQPLDAVAGQKIHLGLIGLQVRDILLQRPLLARRGGEPRQRQQFLAPLKILVDAFLDDRAETIPDLLKIFRLLFGELLQFADHPAGYRFADLHQLRIVLQHLARDVERQVFAVDHAADEAQIGRQQIGIVGDEHAPHIELHLALARRLEQVERFYRWREQ